MEVYDELRRIVREAPAPSDALAQVRSLRRRHPAIDFDLVWDKQPYDASVHYNAILSAAGSGSISLSVQPEACIPWPLRGVQRHDEREVLRVNGVPVQVEEAMQLMDTVWREAKLLRKLVDSCLLRKMLGDDPEVSDEELQHAMDEFRAARGLHTAEKTLAWMTETGISHARLEALMAEQVAIEGLRNRITEPLVDGYFLDHKDDLVQCQAVRVRAHSHETCAAVASCARDRGINLASAAMERLGVDRSVSIDVIQLRRCELPPDLGVVFSARPGDVVGPSIVDGSWVVLQLTAFQAPVLDEATRALCKQHLFADWLDQQRSTARIEWNWGTAEQTRDVS